MRRPEGVKVGKEKLKAPACVVVVEADEDERASKPTFYYYILHILVVTD